MKTYIWYMFRSVATWGEIHTFVIFGMLVGERTVGVGSVNKILHDEELYTGRCAYNLRSLYYSRMGAFFSF